MSTKLSDVLSNSPGSFNKFVAQSPEVSGDKALADYSKALGVHRIAIAEALGVTPDELHTMSPDSITNNT